MKTLKIFTVLVLFTVAGCASNFSPAKLECTGVCSGVSSKQAISKCKAQATINSLTYSYYTYIRECMNGEGWEYLACSSEQEAECKLVTKNLINEE